MFCTKFGASKSGRLNNCTMCLSVLFFVKSTTILPQECICQEEMYGFLGLLMQSLSV